MCVLQTVHASLQEELVFRSGGLLGTPTTRAATSQGCTETFTYFFWTLQSTGCVPEATVRPGFPVRRKAGFAVTPCVSQVDPPRP